MTENKISYKLDTACRGISGLIVHIFVFLMTASSFASAGEVPAMPDRYVVDLASVIDGDKESALNGFLAELEAKTTAQVVVLTVDSLDGRSVEEYSLSVAEKWKLGQKGKDNGVLILIAPNEKRYRFEIGYGLEGVIPDSLAGSMGRQYLVPYFRRGDYSGGIAAATLAIAGEIARTSGVEITGMPEIRPSVRIEGKKPGLMTYVLSAVFFLAMIYLFIKHPWLMLLLLFSGGGHRRSYWGGGGGFGGGGFGGGGGGGFGGGGASGSW